MCNGDENLYYKLIITKFNFPTCLAIDFVDVSVTIAFISIILLCVSELMEL